MLLILLTLLFAHATSTNANEEQSNIAQVMASISAIVKNKLSNCKALEMRDGDVETQIKAMEKAVEYQEGLMVDLNAVSKKVMERINEYTSPSTR